MRKLSVGRDELIEYAQAFHSSPTRHSIQGALLALEAHYEPQARKILEILWDDADDSVDPDYSIGRDPFQEFIEVMREDSKTAYKSRPRHLQGNLRQFPASRILRKPRLWNLPSLYSLRSRNSITLRGKKRHREGKTELFLTIRANFTSYTSAYLACRA